MTIFLNGQRYTLAASVTLAELMTELQLSNKRIALELNREIIPRSAFPQIFLQPEDQVEIVHAIGGG